jgi:23S rRNA (pseudouridine1915-N3)-methyltransferase
VKLRIVALGHRMPAWITTGYSEYAKRLPREFALELVELKPGARTTGAPQILAAEATRVRAACAGSTMVALDEHGAAWTTRQLAQRLQQWRDAAEDVAFVIGSADGLVRVILAEQLYRSASILAGHPYHRD